MNLKTKIIIGIFIFLSIIYIVDQFFDTYTFVSPIKRLEFQWIIQRREPPKNIKDLPKKLTKKAGENHLAMGVLAKNKSNVELEPSITPKPKTDKEIIFSYKHGEILWKIYGLESSWGKNDDCKNQGKYNGFGYGQNNYVWNCFNSFEEVVEKVNNWFDKRLKENGNNLTEALCYYNLGLERQVNCMYYQKFISL